jgi:hypothetical protein
MRYDMGRIAHRGISKFNWDAVSCSYTAGQAQSFTSLHHDTFIILRGVDITVAVRDPSLREISIKFLFFYHLPESIHPLPHPTQATKTKNR